MKNFKKIFCFIAIVFCFVAVTTMTTLAANSVICNHSWVMVKSEGEPCNGYYTLYVCSACYETKEEETEATQSHKWVVTYSQPVSCTKDGAVMAYCEVCVELKSEIIKAPGHSYTYASNNDATCTRDGTKIRRCQVCEDTDILPDIGSAKGHKFADEWQTVRASTCLEKGVSKHLCKVCGAEEFRYDELGPHADKDKDYNCDLCSEKLSIFTPVAPEDSTQGECSCKCHKGGIAGFFWKIGNFFSKLFRIKSKQICSCGVYHF